MDISQLAFVNSSKRINEKSENLGLYKLFIYCDFGAQTAAIWSFVTFVGNTRTYIESLNSNYKSGKFID